MYLLTQSKNQCPRRWPWWRQLGVSYNTAWSLKHKLMQVMKEREPLSGRLGHIVQVDDPTWGAKPEEANGGPSSEGKTPLVAAVQVTEEGRPVALRMSCVKGFRKQEMRPGPTGICGGRRWSTRTDPLLPGSGGSRL